MVRLFVDPGTKSVGVALYDKKKLIDSATLTAVDSKSSFHRMLHIVDQMFEFINKNDVSMVDETHLEQLVRMTHIMVHWSVGAIGTAAASVSRTVEADIPIQSWKLFSRSEKGIALNRKYKNLVKSGDEMCAIIFGAYYVNSIKQEDL